MGGGSRWNFDDISFHSGDRGRVIFYPRGRRVCDSKTGRRPKVNFFRGGGGRSSAVIKPDLSCNLLRPAAAVNYPGSRN